MNILYCGNEKMADGLLISILSLLKHSTEPLNIYIMTASIQTNKTSYYPVSDQTVQFLAQQVKQVNPLNSVTKIDVTTLFNEEKPLANLNTIFTPYCMLRLFADLVSGLPNKLLYLDTDIVCHRNFRSFYHQDISRNEFVGVLDYYGKWFFHNSGDHFDYVNSGVLLLNLKLIKKTGLFSQCRSMCQEKKMFMPDQSAINKLATSKKIVSHRFNDQRRLHRKTVFQHFTTSFRLFPWIHTLKVKPWEVDKVHDKLGLYEYDDILTEYRHLMPKMKGL
ncbi:glycosyl transferase [Loigolactobacillus backii]|uniref:glycosyltransferase n=1 Tax=Loigolactobacillus backii TaxID=375175 RepID=UPI000C1C907A|nr:glycosyltransferase [Loigolactobacillus backii]PIO84144.1 glycosyl transferase [Loigolactobacillus backii]